MEKEVKEKHIPVRMCIVCRQRFPKNELFRYVFAAGRVPVEDHQKIMPGRGFYVCGKRECMHNMIRRLPRR